MRRFTRRMFVNDEQGYKNLLRQRNKVKKELDAFISQWVAPAKQKEIDKFIRDLVYTHQQTVSYQTEYDVNEEDIHIY